MIRLHDPPDIPVSVDAVAPIGVGGLRRSSHQICKFVPFDRVVGGYHLNILKIVQVSEHVPHLVSLVILVVHFAPVSEKQLDMSPDPAHFKQMVSEKGHAVDPLGEEIGLDDSHAVPNRVFNICLFPDYYALFPAVSPIIRIGFGFHHISQGLKTGVLVPQDQNIRNGNMDPVDDGTGGQRCVGRQLHDLCVVVWHFFPKPDGMPGHTAFH